jgi:hypothetical protein
MGDLKPPTMLSAVSPKALAVLQREKSNENIQRQPMRCTCACHKTKNTTLNSHEIGRAISSDDRQFSQWFETKAGINTSTGSSKQWGIVYEEQAAQSYEAQTGETCLRVGYVGHPTISWMGGEPDRITTSGKLVEIKTSIRLDTPNVPLSVDHHAQVQIMMEILDLDMCDLVRYQPARKNFGFPEVIHIIPVPRDKQWFGSHFPLLESVHIKLTTYHQTGEMPAEVAQHLQDTRRRRVSDSHGGGGLASASVPWLIPEPRHRRTRMK